ncbi:PIN domain-containing protein [Sphingobacterium sp.]|uniref:PIN domain-containing protein n=1 Tax=Sphingobacterium sp. TaxID=341027 RepID=UPI0031DFED51
MINLILDTNAWIYLANGFNPDTGKYDKESHFVMLEWINKHFENGSLTLFINEVIQLELERNIEYLQVQVKNLDKQISDLDRELYNKRNQENIKDLMADAQIKINQLKDRIAKNKTHILKVESIIKASKVIPVTERQKITVVDWALKKIAPFHRKPNSVGDALIFLNIVEYFDYDPEAFVDDTIFVSNNTSDFSDDKNKARLHPELQKLINKKPIQYRTNLASVMNLGEEIIREYNDYIEYKTRSYYICEMGCKGAEMGMGEVFIDKILNIPRNDQYERYNPSQTRIVFGDENDLKTEELEALEKGNFKNIEIGHCGWCNAVHVFCHCGEVNASYDNEISCECGEDYSKILKN